MNLSKPPSSPELTLPEKQVTYVLVHGAFQTDSIWGPVRERLEDKGHRVITPVLDAERPEATLRDDLDNFIDATEDYPHLYAVLFSRGCELLRASREMSRTRFLGWALLNTGGPRSLVVPEGNDTDAEMERYTPEFKRGIKSAGRGLSRLDEQVARDTLYSGLRGVALDNAISNLRSQRLPDDNESFHPVPHGTPLISVRSNDRKVHNQARASLVDKVLTGSAAYRVAGDHVPSLSAPDDLANFFLRHAAKLETQRPSA